MDQWVLGSHYPYTTACVTWQPHVYKYYTSVTRDPLVNRGNFIKDYELRIALSIVLEFQFIYHHAELKKTVLFECNQTVCKGK